MKAAAEGKLSFAAYSNPNGHGHIAAVVGDGWQAGHRPGRQDELQLHRRELRLALSKAHEPSYFVHD